MARTKTTPRKPVTTNMEKPKLKTRVNCDKCSKSFVSLSTLRRHYKEQHGPTSTTYDCNHCPATFTRKLNARNHIKEKHPEKAVENYTERHSTPREQAKPIKKWKPPFESIPKVNWEITKPRFRTIPVETPHSMKNNSSNILAEDLYLSDSDTSVKNVTTNEYGYVIDNTPATIPELIDLTRSDSENSVTSISSTQTICLDELPEELWDRECTVIHTYNIFKRAVP